MKTYKFIKLKGHSNWFFVPQNKDDMDDHYNKFCAPIINSAKEEIIHKAINNVLHPDKYIAGHSINEFVSVYEQCFQMNFDMKGLNCLIGINQLENDTIKSHTWKDDIHVCLPNGLKVIDYNDEDIIDEKETFVFEYPKYKTNDIVTIDDVKFLQWPNGTHWYAKIEYVDIVDKNGEQKWNTLEEAKEAALEYIKENYEAKN